MLATAAQDNGIELSAAQIDAAVKAVVCHVLADEEDRRALSGPITDLEAAQAAAAFRAKAESYRAALRQRNCGTSAPWIDWLTDEGFLPVTPTPESHARLGRRLLRGLELAAEENANREAGVYDNAIDGPSLHSPPIAAEKASVPTTVAAGGSGSPASHPARGGTGDGPGRDGRIVEPVPDKHRLTISEAINQTVQFKKGKEAGGFERKYDRAKRIFVEIIGDIPVNDITDCHAVEFRNTALRLPAKKTELKMTCQERVALADKADAALWAALQLDVKTGRLKKSEADARFAKGRVKRLSKKTVNSYMTCLNQTIAWANRSVRPHQRLPNPFEGLIFSQKEREEDSEPIRGFTIEEMRTILSHPYIVKEMDRNPADRSEEWWNTLILMYSPERAEEPAQLFTTDIIVEEGLHCFRIQDSELQRVKTDAANRVVPIPQKLLDLGFLEYVEKQRTAGHTFLFPDLAGYKIGCRHRNVYRYFLRILQDLGLYRRGCVLHALRHTAASILSPDGVRTPQIADILGHARQGVTEENYIGPTSIPEMKRILDRISYE